MCQWEHHTMNSKEATDLATRAFFELDTAGIIYNGDNLDMLFELAPRKGKSSMP